jgi:hypothetical protein
MGAIHTKEARTRQPAGGALHWLLAGGSTKAKDEILKQIQKLEEQLKKIDELPRGGEQGAIPNGEVESRQAMRGSLVGIS